MFTPSFMAQGREAQTWSMVACPRTEGVGGTQYFLRLRLFPVGGAVAGLAGQTHATTPTASTAALAPGAH